MAAAAVVAAAVFAISSLHTSSVGPIITASNVRPTGLTLVPSAAGQLGVRTPGGRMRVPSDATVRGVFGQPA